MIYRVELQYLSSESQSNIISRNLPKKKIIERQHSAELPKTSKATVLPRKKSADDILSIFNTSKSCDDELNFQSGNSEFQTRRRSSTTESNSNRSENITPIMAAVTPRRRSMTSIP